MFSLTCNLIIPKQEVKGIISLDISSERTLSIGDTDIIGSIDFPEKFDVYVSVLVLME